MHARVPVRLPAAKARRRGIALERRSHGRDGSRANSRRRGRGSIVLSVFLDVRGRTALVVGGSRRRAEGRRPCPGGRVRSSRGADGHGGLEAGARRPRRSEARAFREKTTSRGVFLVYAATDDAAVNEACTPKPRRAACRRTSWTILRIAASSCRRWCGAKLLQLAVSTSGAAPAAKRCGGGRALSRDGRSTWMLAEVRALVRSRMAGGEAEARLVLEAALATWEC